MAVNHNTPPASIHAELDKIIKRARILRSIAIAHGAWLDDPPQSAPYTYDLWASADKALINAQLGLYRDACSYARDAEDTLARLRRYRLTKGQLLK